MTPGAATTETAIETLNPNLWTIQSPNLYPVQLQELQRQDRP